MYMDRLSALPDCLIFHIFWFLPMSDVVRTTILSKRWENLWTRTPFLNFDNYTVIFHETYKLLNFVKEALSRWKGQRVLKFRLDSWDDVDCLKVWLEPWDGIDHYLMDRYIDLWLHFATKNQVEELYMHLELQDLDWEKMDPDRILQSYSLPDFVYSCSSLKVLSLKICLFRLKENVNIVQWNRLKSLSILNGFGDIERMVNQVMSCSPLLEVLIISLQEDGDSLCIRSSSLKKLSIYKYLDPDKNFDALSLTPSELTIWVPNLETLTIKGTPYRKCLLMDVPSLTHATLGCYGLHCLDFEEEYDFLGKDVERGMLSSDDFLGEGFCQILPNIQHAENVTLLFCCIKVLEAMTKRCIYSSFPNVKSLQLGSRFNRYEQLVGLLEIFPQLEKLILQVRAEDECNEERELLDSDAKSHLEFEANLSNSSVLRLRTVEVTWFEGDNVFPFLKLLLKYANKLEKMVVRVKGMRSPSNPSNTLLLASQRLLGMPRSSPTAQLIICDCEY